ncbi:ferrous iron transport protein B [Clostridium botulinum]|uniref:Ferrous iron transport protein B n=1 Tax=Clostridium botulinum (strain Hall / ATCC 3502 / NCTC 13319 / Type A) TaxID=441771 RepID=A5I0R9_CLOBH|nr:ferrous iron transport protein B [Clostridium botulinum]ABS33188.1 ferrous iron transport protein B [Clostridium botulinum A str. ATCC 19397]ABS38984.1 ferrous iron transport protein B [Clostridium botulinum A str. Hall]AWB16998.1 ferrous iron transport protein B [Clostridium botulinum]AWB29795.1 ferrous iron transport protein B [Clostridium botulinum]EGT5614871.1 ferrous iron transport protein B [Clostridium botulinum]
MITTALLGNPNVGKTSLFNQLTGSNQYVGNWAGVTVEKKEGFVNDSIKIVDLPGIYAMDTFSNEEKVSKNFLINGNVDVIIDIVDASNLDRNLYLTTQLKQFNKPIILVLNMIDVAENKGIKINYDILSKELNVKVIPIIASKGIGIDKLIETLENKTFLNYKDDNDYNFESERDAYKFIGNIIEKAVTLEYKKSISNTDKIDKIVLNPVLAYPLFLGILYIIFKFTFNWVGTPLADYIDTLLNDSLIPYLGTLLESTAPWFKSLLLDGIVAGVGSVIVFLPVILTLFLGISFLEDSGYMARAAFIMDKLMRKMGLSGKAFIPMVVGFGCSVPGIMSARTLESERDRKLTALLVPLMSCNARLPVYALFASVFFSGHETSIVFSLYILGILLAFIIGLLFKNTLFKKDEEPFIIELPEYKMPEFKNLMLHTWDKGKGFLKKAGTIIFSISVIVWLLSNFNFSGMVDINESFLASLGRVLSPIFKPLGFSGWQTSVSLLTGLMAKEVIVGTMGVIYGGDLKVTLLNHFTPLSAYSFLVFVLLYTPCVSVVATMRKEYGSRMALFSVTYQIILAWIISFLIYNVGALII